MADDVPRIPRAEALRIADEVAHRWSGLLDRLARRSTRNRHPAFFAARSEWEAANPGAATLTCRNVSHKRRTASD